MEKAAESKQKKKLGKKINSYHYYYKRKGVYQFLIKNVVKLIIGLTVLVGLLILAQNFAPSLGEKFDYFLDKFTPLSIISVFFISECLLGLIPPDLFIVWAQKFNYPYLMVGLLAILSYAGGVISYFIGNYLGHLPKIEAYVKQKFIAHIDLIKRWGGVLIVFSTLFPLPFSPVSMAAGMVRFPFGIFLTLALFRFARFFGYALVLFKVF